MKETTSSFLVKARKIFRRKMILISDYSAYSQVKCSSQKKKRVIKSLTKDMLTQKKVQMMEMKMEKKKKMMKMQKWTLKKLIVLLICYFSLKKMQ